MSQSSSQFLTDEQFALIEPLFPRNRGKWWRKSKNDRLILEGIFHLLKTGEQWRDVPERYGKWLTIYMRFYRWSEDGTWWNILTELQKHKVIDIRILFMDSTSIRAHPCSAGARKKRGLKHSEDQKVDLPRKYTP